MPLCALRMIAGVRVADAFTNLAQPDTRPGELDAQYCKPDRYDDKSGSGRDQHYDPENEYRQTDRENSDSTGRLVGQVNSFLNHLVSAGRLCFREIITLHL